MLKFYKDFPKKGVNFIDIFPYIQDYADEVSSFFSKTKANVVLLPEARAFMFAAAIGLNRCVPLRKVNKLPGELIEIPYKKEYGDDKLYFNIEHLLNVAHKQNLTHLSVSIIDDVLATGGTAKAIIDKINNLNVSGCTFYVDEVRVLAEITELKGRDLLGVNVESLIKI